ncbi:MAG TPA: hypothetical protein VHY20_03940 [Pirellulales bacterium]|nr:hypothetical protein [Pirellulales bacterium]
MLFDSSRAALADDPSGTATIELWLPKGASLRVNGKRVKTPPGHHSVSVPNLDPKLEYQYRLRVEFEDKPELNEQRVVVFGVDKPGKVDFRKPKSSAAKNPTTRATPGIGAPTLRPALVNPSTPKPAIAAQSEVRQASAEDEIKDAAPAKPAPKTKTKQPAPRQPQTLPDSQPQAQPLLQAPKNAPAAPQPSEAGQQTETIDLPATRDAPDE